MLVVAAFLFVVSVCPIFAFTLPLVFSLTPSPSDKHGLSPALKSMNLYASSCAFAARFGSLLSPPPPTLTALLFAFDAAAVLEVEGPGTDSSSSSSASPLAFFLLDVYLTPVPARRLLVPRFVFFSSRALIFSSYASASVGAATRIIHTGNHNRSGAVGTS